MSRARSPAAKTERRALILHTAAQLFQQQPYDSITMQAVASAAGLAKGTLYLYFTTKEALFVALYQQEFGLWMDAVDALLEQPVPQADFAAALCASLRPRPDFLRLAVILHSILEQNADDVVILTLKQTLIQRISQTCARLHTAYDWPPAAGIRFFNHLNALVIGLYPMAYPAPAAARVQAAHQLTAFAIDLFVELEYTLRRLMPP